MPELPEVESARSVIERNALGRKIVDVDDTDTYVCRPHPPGEIRTALLTRRLTVAHRRGKSMWCDTSGVGNLLADQALWLARINPARPVRDLSQLEIDRLLRGLRRAVRSAVDGGGVHTLPILAFRKTGAHCPRCGSPMNRGTVGGRTTWWCSNEQT